ncbi:methyltransferase [Streptomyces radicis]|uniref:Methyltransferase domain-containing protein n=1 Tax=Streptomyces radicis TaxID=1750517 RepID=A0A3A9W2X2_9ACTN|nr:methyltransferase [Streptomyces radicis]RKN07605.1 methyltransferase domain-containing protein [Streptomyces radicis]RKN18328.1 methyltransferase domain-containing protein [Streptomyces radicis]
MVNFKVEGERGLLWRKLGTLLRRHGYTTEAVRNVLEVREPAEAVLADVGRYSLFYMGALKRSESPVAVIARLFLFCGHVPAVDLDRTDPELAALLWRLGLVEQVAGDEPLVRATVALVELRSNYFISDKLFENAPGGFTVHDGSSGCMPPHASSVELLSGLKKPAAARSFLDVGCGSGCQSVVFASDYECVAGFDVDERAVEFAQVNAAINGLSGRYEVSSWESFRADRLYDHIVFNSPDPSVAFDFIGRGLEGMLSRAGHAQVWLNCEVGAEDQSLEHVLLRSIENPERFDMESQENANSPFSVGADFIRSRKFPEHTLLVSHPGERASYMRDLVERGVREIVSVILTIRLRHHPRSD